MKLVKLFLVLHLLHTGQVQLAAENYRHSDSEWVLAKNTPSTAIKTNKLKQSLENDNLDSLGAVIYPGEDEERFRKWIIEILGKKDPAELGKLVTNAQWLFQSDKMLSLPIVQYLENLYTDMNTSILIEEADTLKIYLGNLDSNKILHNRFLITHSAGSTNLREYSSPYISDNLSLLGQAMHKAKNLHNTFIEGNGIIPRIHVKKHDSLITVHILPIASSDSIAIGGGLKTLFTLNMDSTLESIQLHLGYEIYPADTTRPFQYKTSTIERKWTEIDLAQYLLAQQKLKPSKTPAEDYNSVILKYIQENFVELINTIDSLKYFNGFQSDLMMKINDINIAKIGISNQIQTATDILSIQSRPLAHSNAPMLKPIIDTLKARLGKTQSLIEKNLKSLTHDKTLAELELFSNVWITKTPKEYSFVLKRKCFCSATFAGPFVVTIKDKEVIEVKHMKINQQKHKKKLNRIGGKNKFSIITHFGSFSLDGIIRETKSFINMHKPFIVEIDYNEIYGYPDKIKFDPNVFIQGDELTITVGELNIPSGSREKKSITK